MYYSVGQYNKLLLSRKIPAVVFWGASLAGPEHCVKPTPQPTCFCSQSFIPSPSRQRNKSQKTCLPFVCASCLTCGVVSASCPTHSNSLCLQASARRQWPSRSGRWIPGRQGWHPGPLVSTGHSNKHTHIYTQTCIHTHIYTHKSYCLANNSNAKTTLVVSGMHKASPRLCQTTYRSTRFRKWLHHISGDKTRGARVHFQGWVFACHDHSEQVDHRF